jgi:hypothetical protein
MTGRNVITAFIAGSHAVKYWTYHWCGWRTAVSTLAGLRRTWDKVGAALILYSILHRQCVRGPCPSHCDRRSHRGHPARRVSGLVVIQDAARISRVRQSSETHGSCVANRSASTM